MSKQQSNIPRDIVREGKFSAHRPVSRSGGINGGRRSRIAIASSHRRGDTAGIALEVASAAAVTPSPCLL